MLQQTFAQNPATDDEQRDVLTRYDGEPDEVVDELPRLREELARLQANVNLNAEADRDELTERERFLREQMDDLHRARETLLATIAEIEVVVPSAVQRDVRRGQARVQRDVRRSCSPAAEAEMWQTDPEQPQRDRDRDRRCSRRARR